MWVIAFHFGGGLFEKDAIEFYLWWWFCLRVCVIACVLYFMR